MRNFDDCSTAAELRKEALVKLGGKCSFEGCDWAHPDVLEIDHIIPVSLAGLEREHRYTTYLTIVRLRNPGDYYQVLCANHHKLKTVRDMEDILEARQNKKVYFEEVPLDISESLLDEDG